MHPNAIVREVRNSMKIFDKIRGDASVEHQQLGGDDQQMWKALSVRWHKANWDAATDISRGLLGFGIVIRDHAGEVVAAKCMHMQGNSEVNGGLLCGQTVQGHGGD